MKLLKYGVLVFGLAIIGWYWWLKMDTSEVARIETLAPQDKVPQSPSIHLMTDSHNFGVDFHPENGAYGEKLLPETMGQGVAIVDMDGDDDEDLIFVNGKPWNNETNNPKLLTVYLNDGMGHFKRVEVPGLSQAVGYGQAIAVADLNGDRRPDIYVTCVGSDQLFMSSDNGYRRMRGPHEGAQNAWSSAAVFFDQDNDGDLDLLVAEYLTWSLEIDRQINFQMAGIGKAYGPPKDYAGGKLRLYENSGQGRFRDVSEKIRWPQGEDGRQGVKALALQLLDVNDDGRLDVFVANDTTANQLFINDGRHLTNQAEEWGVAYDNMGHATGAMGTDVYINREGQWLIVGNFADESDSLYWRRPTETFFMDMAAARGLGASTRQVLTFGTLFVDLNMDGQPELVQVNGHVENEIHRVSSQQTYAQRPQVFAFCASCGNQWRLTDALSTERWVGRGLATGDLNNDGMPDLVVTQVASAPVILHNQTQPVGRILSVKLVGPKANAMAIGAKVELWHGSTWLGTKYQIPVRGYYSQSSAKLLFGLPKELTEVTVKVRWPDGSQTVSSLLLQSALEHVRLEYDKLSSTFTEQ